MLDGTAYKDREEDEEFPDFAAVWIPVAAAAAEPLDRSMTQVALPIPGPLEAVPGLWPTNGRTGMLCVCNVDVFEAALEPGR